MAKHNISVIVRSHSIERIEFLKRSLFSLSVQVNCSVHIICVLQRFKDSEISIISSEIETMMSDEGSIRSYDIINIQNPETGDLRTDLLNSGLAACKSQFVAILDDDDLVYHYAYSELINSALKTKSAISFGRSVRVFGGAQGGRFYAISKDRPYKGGSIIDLIVDNFAPIHSYVFDRSLISLEDLYFDNISPYLEDYRLLLRIISKYQATFMSMEVDVCEYWFYDDKMNTTGKMSNRFSDVAKEWREAYQETEKLKSELNICLSYIDIELWTRSRLSRSFMNFTNTEITDTVIQAAWSKYGDLKLSRDLLVKN